jgi:hypothetical protein
VPSRVFALACRLKPRRFSSRPTSFWPALKPKSASAAEDGAGSCSPTASCLRIAADRGLHQVIQGFQKPRLCLDRQLAAATLSPNPRAEHHRARTQVCQAAIDRTARNSRRPRYRNDPAMSGRTRLTGREQPPLSLVQNWLKRLDGSDVNHHVRISAPAAEARQFTDSFVAFLPLPRFFSADSVVLAQALS